MENANIEINVLVKGRKVTEYMSPMDFQTYVEGRDGSEFEIELVNRNTVDVEAIVSIDGLSVTDGKPAGTQSSGYLVSAQSRVVIPGWTLDGNSAAKFQFAGAKGGSYVERIGGDASNKGVIGAKVFARKPKPVTYSGGLRSIGSFPVMGGSGPWKNIVATNAVYGSATFAADTATLSSSSAGMLPVEQTLGTDFGQATDFRTTKVDFERGDIISVIAIFYDDRQGLKRRGIDPSRTSARPSPFPADETGCTPPPGWSK